MREAPVPLRQGSAKIVYLTNYVLTRPGVIILSNRTSQLQPDAGVQLHLGVARLLRVIDQCLRQCSGRGVRRARSTSKLQAAIPNYIPDCKIFLVALLQVTASEAFCEA